jgi:hypothetical protein
MSQPTITLLGVDGAVADVRLGNSVGAIGWWLAARALVRGTVIAEDRLFQEPIPPTSR